jgi:hypothetical protein
VELSPIALEKAMNARFGLSPWAERFDQMVPSYERSESRFF